MSGAAIDTIVAPATPLGRSALAIVRLDGPDAISVTSELTGIELIPRSATRVRITGGGGEIDDAVAIYFPAPHSFTGNDVVEFYLHGNPLLVQRTLRAAIASGCRMAEPGEFTERAVLNGKVDLVQAEAIRDLIEARTALQARVSLGQLDGRLSEAAHGIREDLMFVIARLEAALDFADEGYEFIRRDEVAAKVRSMIDRLGEMVGTYDRGRAVTHGVTAVILGQPNAGKSTLLNCLCGSDRAIVTEIPGTTRDLLRETIELGGLPVTLVDTAGLRESSDRIEVIGIERARAVAEEASIILYLVDASRGLTVEDEREIARLNDPVVVYTKSDLKTVPEGALAISAATGAGMSAFIELIDREVRERFVPEEGQPLVVNERQRLALAECRDALISTAETIHTSATEEILLVDLYRSANALGSLTGAISHEQLMAEIFGKFCIGK